MLSVWVLMTVHLHAQQSIADALRRAHAMPVVAETQGFGSPANSLEEALRSIYQRAEIVFTGEVTSVERTGDAVAVTFRVDDGIRSVESGSTYVLREWAGLWADDSSRYVVGERRLMLLHAASVCGFASPAGGQLGAIRLHGDAVQGTADLRWIAAQVSAASGAAPVRSAFAKTSLFTEAAVVTDQSAMDGAVVTDMLHAWQRAEAAQ
jgi:hypothetical protein